MWDLPEPGIKPMSPALARGFLTTGPTREVLPTDLKLISSSLLGLPVCPNPLYFPAPFLCPAWFRAPLSDPLVSLEGSL